MAREPEYLPEELKIKEQRLTKIKAAKEALEQREQALYPGKKIDDKKQISFADKEARIMVKKGDFNYSYNGQITVDQDNVYFLIHKMSSLNKMLDFESQYLIFFLKYTI